MESPLVRFLRELKVPGLVAFIVATVWVAAYCQRIEEQARVYRLPAARIFAAQEPAESEVENDLAVSAPVEPLDHD